MPIFKEDDSDEKRVSLIDLLRHYPYAIWSCGPVKPLAMFVFGVILARELRGFCPMGILSKQLHGLWPTSPR